MSNTKRKYNKKGKILIHLGNVYALGGDLMGGLLVGAASLGTQALSNLTVPEVENLKITATNNDALMAEMAASLPVNLGRNNVGSSALSGVSTGALAGMAFGPWGAAIGGAIGGLSGGISSLVGNKKREIAENQANALQANKFQSAASNIQKSLMNNLLANYAANGGSLGMTGMMNSGKFANGGGLNTFENGGTHEQNPLGGIPQGVDENGTPNLVEQGESKFQNYIFSDRLKYDKKNTFSDMAKKFAKESKERPNDPISKRGLESNLGKLKLAQDFYKTISSSDNAANTFKYGGPTLFQMPNWFKMAAEKPVSLTPPTLIEKPVEKPISPTPTTVVEKPVDGGPTLFQMPNWFKMAAEKPVPLIPPTVVEDPVSSPPPTVAKKPVVRPPINKSVATLGIQDYSQELLDDQLAALVEKPVVRTPINKSVATLGIQDYSQELLDDQLAALAANTLTPRRKSAPSKVEINNAIMGENLMDLDPIVYNPKKDKKGKKDYSPFLRYAPALASGIATLTDALGTTNKPDYTAAKELEGIQVKGERLGNYLSYRPLDQNYFINLLRANAAATRSALRGASGGNRATYMAGLIGADSSYNEGLGKLARQAVESNIAQKHQVEQFNRGTDQFNAQQGNWEQGINAQNKATAVGLREQARQTANTAKMTNLNNFLESIGGIGQENLFRNMIKNDPSSPHYIDATGKFVFKGSEGNVGKNGSEGNVGKNGSKLKTKSITYGW